MTTFTTTATNSEKERHIEDMLACLRTKMDYDEFRDLAPHLGIRLQNGYYGDFDDAEKNDGIPAKGGLVKVALFFFMKDLAPFVKYPEPDIADKAKELFATLLWRGGEAEARGNEDIANAYNVIYDTLMQIWRNVVLSDDATRDAFAYAYDEESWAKNIDGRVYWVKKIRKIAEQLAKEEA